MSYGKGTIHAGDALHVIGFPDLVRVAQRRLQIQLSRGCLEIQGTGMPLIFRDLLAGELQHIEVGDTTPGGTVERIEAAAEFTDEKTEWLAAECCPVPDDVILVETTTGKDYLSRSSLIFFGRYGRRKDSFLLGFLDRSYKIQAMPGQADAFAAAVFASRLARGSANVFTTLDAEYFLPFPEFFRHQVRSIEAVPHEPDDWGVNGLFIATLTLGERKLDEGIPTKAQRPDSPGSSQEI